MQADAIIITSDEPYSASWHTQLMYAEYLSRHNLVIFLDPPKAWKPANLVRGPLPVKKVSDALYVMPYHNRYPSTCRRWNESLNAKRLKKQLKRIHASRLLLWQFDSFRNGLLADRWIRKRLTKRVYHVTDPFMRNPLDSALAKAADLIVVMAESNLELYRKYSEKVMQVPQAIDTKLAEQYLREPVQHEVPMSFALVLGTVSDSLDFAVLSEIARAGINLVFAGEKKGLLEHAATFDEIVALPNVRYLGMLQPRQFYPLIAASFAGIITYGEESRRGRAVLKYLHFLAAGKPVISNTGCGSAEIRNKCVFEAKTVPDFLSLCAVAENGRLSFDRAAAEGFLNTVQLSDAVKRIEEKLYGNS